MTDKILIDRAVVEQALRALTCTGEHDDPGHRCGYCDDYVDRNGPVRAALRAALESSHHNPAPSGIETQVNAALGLNQPALAQQPIAYCTEDGERCVTAKTYEGAMRDGGAMKSSMKPYCVRAFAAVAQEPVAWMYDWFAPGHDKPVCDWISQDKGEVFDQRNGYFNIRPLYTTPQPAAVREALTREQREKIITEAGYDEADLVERTAFVNGIRCAEQAHGIGGKA